ncbi:MAG: hypothetical protein JST55_12555 [Bacteroidetes bacterium]|nr:hypothetical protein [Bacteroidota bacterium]
MIESFIKSLLNKSEELSKEICYLLTKYSQIDIHFNSNSFLIYLGPENKWKKLNSEGIKIQNIIYKEYNNFKNLLLFLFEDLPENYLREFKEVDEQILEIISQSNNTYFKTIDETAVSVIKYFNVIISLLTPLESAQSKSYLLIPDTNAFLINPDIENWKFEAFKNFTIILVPTLLKELDKHKMSHNRQEVRDKATKIINKIKEYRRRGKLIEGVIFVKNKIDLIGIATEPDFNKTLMWLDQKNDDDVFLASTLEIIKHYLHSIVIVVTNDLNLQSKCELANVPYLETPIDLKITK